MHSFVSEIDPVVTSLFLRFVYAKTVLEQVIESEKEGSRYLYQYTTEQAGKKVRFSEPYPYPDFVNGISNAVLDDYRMVRDMGYHGLLKDYLKGHQPKPTEVPDVFKNAFK